MVWRELVVCWFDCFVTTTFTHIIMYLPTSTSLYSKLMGFPSVPMYVRSALQAYQSHIPSWVVKSIIYQTSHQIHSTVYHFPLHKCTERHCTPLHSNHKSNSIHPICVIRFPVSLNLFKSDRVSQSYIQVILSPSKLHSIHIQSTSTSKLHPIHIYIQSTSISKPSHISKPSQVATSISLS